MIVVIICDPTNSPGHVILEYHVIMLNSIAQKNSLGHETALTNSAGHVISEYHVIVLNL